MQFPKYRKLDGFQRYYKIVSDRLFIEISLLNGKTIAHEVEAKQYPEMLRIQDMLEMRWNYRTMDAEEIGRYFPEEAY